MTRLTITAKGQVTLKQELLRHLRAAPVDRIEIDKLTGGRILVRAAVQDGTITDFIGCLSQPKGSNLTIEDTKALAVLRSQGGRARLLS